MAESVTCKNCNATIEIPDGHNRPFIQCLQCKRMVTVSIPSKAAGSAAPRPPAPPPMNNGGFAPPPPPMTSSAPGPIGPGEALPEIMKANKRIAGRNCTICGAGIQIGEQVHNCPKCRESAHEACWNRVSGCRNPACSGDSAPAAPGRQMAGTGSMAPMNGDGAGGAGGQNLVPCRFCKEPIVRGARKCKHCSEFQRDEDRQQQATANSEVDMSLTTTDWIGILCCPLIALIQGLYWVATGNPKGPKIIGYAIISMVVGALLRVAGGH